MQGVELCHYGQRGIKSNLIETGSAFIITQYMKCSGSIVAPGQEVGAIHYLVVFIEF